VVAIRDGRTSSELIRAGETAPQGSQTHEPAPDRRAADELVVLDRAGRLQLPSEQRALAGIFRRARVELVEGGILVRPGDDELGAMGTAEATPDDAGYQSLYSVPAPAPSPRASRWKDWWGKARG